jgi:hypothetical protein
LTRAAPRLLRFACCLTRINDFRALGHLVLCGTDTCWPLCKDD